MNEERILKINFNKSGRGTLTPKLTLPIAFIKDMGITEEERNIQIKYNRDKKQIILTKSKQI